MPRSGLRHHLCALQYNSHSEHAQRSVLDARLQNRLKQHLRLRRESCHVDQEPAQLQEMNEADLGSDVAVFEHVPIDAKRADIALPADSEIDGELRPVGGGELVPQSKVVVEVDAVGRQDEHFDVAQRCLEAIHIGGGPKPVEECWHLSWTSHDDPPLQGSSATRRGFNDTKAAVQRRCRLAVGVAFRDVSAQRAHGAPQAASVDQQGLQILEEEKQGRQWRERHGRLQHRLVRPDVRRAQQQQHFLLHQLMISKGNSHSLFRAADHTPHDLLQIIPQRVVLRLRACYPIKARHSLRRLCLGRERGLTCAGSYLA
eukprot:1478937-Rhodomonas_salina.1